MGEYNALPGTLRNFSHFPLFVGIRTVNGATNETLIDVKKRSISFQHCLKFQKIPIGPGVMTARSCAPKLHSKIVFLLNYLMLIWLAVPCALKKIIKCIFR